MIARFLMVVAALGLVLCAVSCKSARFYSVGVVNRTVGDLQDVTIQWDKETMRLGGVLEGRNVTKTPFFGRPPATVTLSWKSSGESYTTDIDLTNLVPEGFDGTIFMVVRGPDKVGVGAIKDGDRQAYEQLIQAD